MLDLRWRGQMLVVRIIDEQIVPVQDLAVKGDRHGSDCRFIWLVDGRVVLTVLITLMVVREDHERLAKLLRLCAAFSVAIAGVLNGAMDVFAHGDIWHVRVFQFWFSGISAQTNASRTLSK